MFGVVGDTVLESGCHSKMDFGVIWRPGVSLDSCTAIEKDDCSVLPCSAGMLL